MLTEQDLHDYARVYMGGVSEMATELLALRARLAEVDATRQREREWHRDMEHGVHEACDSAGIDKYHGNDGSDMGAALRARLMAEAYLDVRARLAEVERERKRVEKNYQDLRNQVADAVYPPGGYAGGRTFDEIVRRVQWQVKRADDADARARALAAALLRHGHSSLCGLLVGDDMLCIECQRAAARGE